MDLARAMESASSGWAKGLTRFAEQGRGRIGRAHVAQLVEHVLGKDEVSSSILLVGSMRARGNGVGRARDGGLSGQRQGFS